MNYDEEITNLYKQIQDLKNWLLQNVPSLNELEQLKARYDQILLNITNKLTQLEQQVKLLSKK